MAERVRVTSARTAATRARRVRPATEIDRRSTLGEVYLSSLLRTQLRLGLGVLTVVVLTLGALPVLFRAFPRLTRTVVFDMPLPWVLLACAAYPFLFGCGWFYVRRAERNERMFAQLIEPPDVQDQP